MVGHGLAADTKQRGDCCQPVTGCQQAQNLKLAVGERVEILSLGAELAIPQRARQFDGDEAVSRGDCLHGSYHQVGCAGLGQVSHSTPVQRAGDEHRILVHAEHQYARRTRSPTKSTPVLRSRITKSPSVWLDRAISSSS